MKIMNYLLFLLFPLFTQQNISSSEIGPKGKKNIDFGQISYLILKFTNIINTNNTNSINECLRNNKNFTNNLKHIILFSGKDFGDNGDEINCETIGFNYFLYHLKYDPSTYNSTDDGKIKTFLNLTDTYTFFCFPIECISVFNDLLTHGKHFFQQFTKDVTSKSVILKRNFLENSTIDYTSNSTNHSTNNITYDYAYYINKLRKDPFVEKSVENKYNKLFKVLFIIIICYLIFICVCTFIKMFFFFSISLNEEEKKNEDDEEEEEEEEDENEDELDDSNFVFQNQNFKEPLNKKSTVIFKKNDEMFKIKSSYQFIRVLTSFDIFFNINLLLNFSNKYYNNSSIEIIGFIRIIIIFLIIYGKNFLMGITFFPQKDIYNHLFYESINFIFIKLTFFSSIIWIILDGTIFGFKFMSYLKKKKNNISKPKTFFIFFKYLIPKVILFLLIYFCIDIMISNYSDKNLFLDYYIKRKSYNLECYNHPFKVFNPIFFYLNQTNVTTNQIESSLNNYQKCYEYTNIYLNEFYSIIFLCLIIFLSFNIQKKIFDIIISSVILINLFTVPLTYKREIQNLNNIYFDIFLGQKFTEQHFHLFLSIFFLGFLIGLIFFHYYDSISNHPFSDNDNHYVPFSFTKNFMIKINELELKYKAIISIFCILILIFICSPIYFCNNQLGKSKNDDTTNINLLLTILKYFDIFEKSLFAIVFFFLLIFLKFITENAFFLKSGFISTFEKIKIPFYCSIDNFIILCYSLFEVCNYLSYLNLLHITVGIYILAYFFNYLMTILFLLPFEKLIKNKFKNKKLLQKSLVKSMISLDIIK